MLSKPLTKIELNHRYQNLFEVLFSPDLHLLSAMFEVMPEDEQVTKKKNTTASSASF